MDNKIRIRFAESADLEAIRALVVELAIFEKEPDAVLATLNDYQEAFNSGLITVFVAETADEIVGMTLFYDTFSTWKGKMLYMEDFVVKEAYRSKGVGKLLFDKTLAYAQESGCQLMKWQVLDWNEGAVKFYEREGATIEREWWNGKIVF
jgi:GNAT superfamily N-acetyltransferase